MTALKRNRREENRLTRERLCYPGRLREAEQELVDARREAAGVPINPNLTKADDIGLALSGGGIRSATFCLGVLQAMAASKWLRKVDYLSTVSGGGYIGSFLGRLFTRDWVKDDKATFTPEKLQQLQSVADALNETAGVARVEKILDDHQSEPLVRLRESGRYIAPDGGGDLVFDLAIAFRNWAAVTVVVLVTLLTIFFSLETLRAWLWQFEEWRDIVEGPLIVRTEHHWWWSPTLILPAIAFLVSTLPLGWAFWLTQKKHGDGWGAPPAIVVAAMIAGACLCAFFGPMSGQLASRVVAVIAAVPLVWYAWATAGWCGGFSTGAFGALVIALFAPAWFGNNLYSKTTMAIAFGAITVMGFLASDRSENSFPKIRTKLSNWLTVAFVITIVLLILAIVDSLGQMAYAMLRLENGPGLKSFLSVAGVMVLFSFAKRIKLLVARLPQRKAAQVPLKLVATLAAVILASVVLVSLSAISHGFAWQWRNPGIKLNLEEMWSECAEARGITNIFVLPGTNLVAQFNGPRVKLNPDDLIKVTEAPSDPGCPCEWEMNYRWTGYAALACFVLAICFGRTLTFLNLSSHAMLYAARLTRAYHGASNPERWSGQTQKIGDFAPGDDLCWRAYDPHLSGGPLHIVNVTLNETVGGKSQVQDRDRHGLIMALGPCGMTIGAKFHALRSPLKSAENKSGDARTTAAPITVKELFLGGDRDGTEEIEPLPSVREEAGRKRQAELRVATQQLSESDETAQSLPEKSIPFGYHPLHGKSERQKIETLRLSRWIGISGAAFSTGLGRATSFGTSFIAGMANVRLGYWWDSHVDPKDRKVELGENYVRGNFLQKLVARIMPVQAHLFDEFLAQFRGPNDRLWYLSDGGHFENTGAYELIRRRLPLIIICDCGADPHYNFADLANLTRLVRIDFGAEIEFLPPEEVLEHVPGANPDFFGLPKDFMPESNNKVDDRGPHALLAEVTYPKPDERESQPSAAPQKSYIVVLKPGVSGDEPLDVVEYMNEHPLFPQEPTADQFFDEAQWESYRKLGRHIGEKIFGMQTAKD